MSTSAQTETTPDGLKPGSTPARFMNDRTSSVAPATSAHASATSVTRKARDRRRVALDSVLVQRMTKNGMREFDARAAVVAVDVEEDRLIMILAHQVPLVRPDDVLAGLQVASPKFAPIDPPVLTRLAQGRLDLGSGLITEPGH